MIVFNKISFISAWLFENKDPNILLFSFMYYLA